MAGPRVKVDEGPLFGGAFGLTIYGLIVIVASAAGSELVPKVGWQLAIVMAGFALGGAGLGLLIDGAKARR